MSSVLAPVSGPPRQPDGRRPPVAERSDAFILAATAEIAAGPLKKAATAIDGGEYPVDIMRALGGAGALGAHLDRDGRRFGLAIEAMAEASRFCGATGFLMWCHDVCGLYLEQSGNPALAGAVLEEHASAHTFGGTALSNPMKTFAGIEKMLLHARRVPGGYSVSGSLPWVSHIREGQYCGAIAAVEDDGGTVAQEIMFLLRFDGRAELRPCPHFSGMEGTSTWGIRLRDFHVGPEDLIADPARPFIGRIRAAFVLLQCGMGLGVAQGSVDSMQAVEDALGHVNRFLRDRPDDVQSEVDELRSRVRRLAATPFADAPEFLIEVLDTRAAIAELALRASQSALLHQGARGYAMTSAVQRRVREAHFVAIVTPAIKHLRSEVSRLTSVLQN